MAQFVRGLHEHARAVDRLLESYRGIPPGARVRLAKKTSNLFRPRATNDTPGLDVSGLDGVISIDTDAWTADVQGICTYEDLVAATLPHGFIPYVIPQPDHHPGWRGHGPRHRVDIVPQRTSARVGARDGHPHRIR
ncbi:hypothetical protein [Aeromicrobium sp. UC242_57]|uniref:hypothetical protein n=1 Tax=Aeromicrobium sp. UC242_57 TaxID=3374624 RepID=UPI00379B77DB